MPSLTIGKLSRRTGCHIETIRYYERTGLLPEPARSAGGQRLYGEDDVRRLSFIRRSRDLGFAVADVRNLLAYVDAGDYSCAEIRALTVDHLAAVQRRIRELRRLERALGDMVRKCDGDEVAGCPILDALSD